MSCVENITNQATWSVSSAESDYGVGNLLDGNITTYWQSNGSSPHIIEISFPTRKSISAIKIYTSYTLDSTYAPLLISVLYGDDGLHFQEYNTYNIGEINGWFVVKPNLEKGPLEAFSLQIVIHEMYHSGKNTRIRQIEVLSPKSDTTQTLPILFSDPFLCNMMCNRSIVC